jgi:hypothetical protein
MSDKSSFDRRRLFIILLLRATTSTTSLDLGWNKAFTSLVSRHFCERGFLGGIRQMIEPLVVIPCTSQSSRQVSIDRIQKSSCLSSVRLVDFRNLNEWHPPSTCTVLRLINSSSSSTSNSSDFTAFLCLLCRLSIIIVSILMS